MSSWRIFFFDKKSFKFSLSFRSGIIKISPYARLDRDVIDNYAIVVNAIDSGVPSETSTATVKVKILDINNKSPR